jgi:hypothetical protein
MLITLRKIILMPKQSDDKHPELTNKEPGRYNSAIISIKDATIYSQGSRFTTHT